MRLGEPRRIFFVYLMENFRYPRHWTAVTNGQIMRATLLVVALLGLAVFIFNFYEVVLILITAVILGTALTPIVAFSERFGIPKWISILLIYLLVLVGLIAAVWFGAPVLIAQTEPLVEMVTASYADFLDRIQNQNYRIARLIVEQFPQDMTADLNNTAVSPDITEPTPTMIATGLESVTGLLRALFFIVATFTLSFYWILEQDEVKRRALFITPSAYRETVQTLWNEVEKKLSSFVIGQFILCFSIFASSFMAYLIIGLPNALALALFAGLMEALPNIGPVIGAIPALLVAFTISPLTAVYVLIASLLIQQLENHILFPRIMDKAVGVRPFVSLLALVGFGTLFGVVGAILSIPIAAITQIFMDYFLLNPSAQVQPKIEGRNQASILQYEANELIMDVRRQIRQKESVANATNDQVEDSIEAIASDLSVVLKRMNQVEPGETV